VTEVHVYVNKPVGKDVPALEEVGDTVSELGCVSDVRADTSGSVIAVSFDGGRTEQEEIEHTIEESGYEIGRLSVRSDFPEQ
jgi:copper chaperone CopZ